jgi:hypothetical protein
MSNVSDPARYGLAVTPSDVTVLNPTRALYIGTTGNLTVRMYGGQNNVTFTTVPVGIFPIQVDRVLATGTTASNIVALS